MKITKLKTLDQIVANWHLLEACQFKCQYCYAEWSKTQLPHVYRCEHNSKDLIDQIAGLQRHGRKVRISFAGGEPLLDKKLTEKIAHAHRCDLAVSLITNGGLLSDRFIHQNGEKITMLGVSIDSLDDATNLSIGRATVSKKLVDQNKIIDLLWLVRQINPNIRIKINTVVNQFNFNEDLSPLIERIKPDKWKVLRVLPATYRSAAQAISDEKFAIFKNKHSHIACAIFEDNECMTNSYLMIDPYGRFFFNKDNQQYSYSEPILAVGIEHALSQTDFDIMKFVNRYPDGVH